MPVSLVLNTMFYTGMLIVVVKDQLLKAGVNIEAAAATRIIQLEVAARQILR